MLALKTLAVTYAENVITPHSSPVISSTPLDSGSSTPLDSPSTRQASPDLSSHQQMVQNWLGALRGWSPPEPLFDWDGIIENLRKSMIGIARTRYTRWHKTLPKRPLPPSDDNSGNGPSKRSARKRRNGP